MRIVKADLLKYANMNICVALSGGRDSMALLHYLLKNGAKNGIAVCAVNFDHKIRGESSSRDSAFVADYCAKNGIPLLFFEWTENKVKTEAAARKWRLERYAEAVNSFVMKDGREWKGADAVATAHHLNDNAETVLFNLARGSGISGLTGIGDEKFSSGGKKWKIIRPFAEVSRAEIDEYVARNRILYVDDETNFSDGYTRNKIRLNVLPELEKAVPGAARAIYRFSRIAAEDEEYFKNLIEERGLIKKTSFGYEISRCEEKVVFKRAVLKIFADCGIRDYAEVWLNTLYGLQFSAKGKKFGFAGCTAYSEEGKIAICIENFAENADTCVDFFDYCKGGLKEFCGNPLYFCGEEETEKEFAPPLYKTLRFDPDKIPRGAVLRFMRAGDRFNKFGGGSKNLGSYFTDLKIPVRVRPNIPVVAKDGVIYIVCGVEISESVKTDGGTKHTALCIAYDFAKRG